MSFWESFLADQDYQDEHQALLASVQHQLTCLLESEAPLLPFGSGCRSWTVQTCVTAWTVCSRSAAR